MTDVPPKYGYIMYKASTFLERGPDAYRQLDAFHFPPQEWSGELLAIVAEGCQQVVRMRGIRPDDAFVGLGAGGFLAMMHLFHFRPAARSTVSIEGQDVTFRMEMLHAVDGEVLELFNRVRCASEADAARTGESPETAILVPDVAAEYHWIRENLPGFSLAAQRLEMHGSTPMDHLIVQGPDSRTHDIFFDISSFFGRDGEETKPCPYCGEPLRTAKARQCRHCKRQWHEARD